jgi:hypothetical protein
MPIFKKFQHSFEAAEKESLEDLLLNISETYKQQKGHYNSEYVVEESLQFIKKRFLEIKVANAQILLENGKINEAEQEFQTYEKFEKETSAWERPFSMEAVDNTFAREEESVFTLRGDIGRFLGSMKTCWLVAIHGAYKLGKTNVLLEWCLYSAIDLKQPTVLFSTEMQKEDIYSRMYKRLLSSCDGTDPWVRYPVFDCELNQTNECQHKNRSCFVAPPDKPTHMPGESYQPCTYCRDHKEGAYVEEGVETRHYKEYKMSTWFIKEKRPMFNKMNVKEKVKVVERFYGRLLWVRTYSKYTANVEQEITNDLNMLEKHENFIPTIIGIDMADTLSPEPDSSSEGTNKEDRTWIALAALAQSRKALVFTPTQVTKSGLSKSTQGTEEVARWSGKLGHVDMYVTLNQTSDEKAKGIMRYGLLEHRHKFFLPAATCTVLNNIGAGQAFLDSYLD